jgi:MFS family permease
MLKAPCDDLSAEAVPKAEKPCSPVWVLLATILGSSMVFIDGSVVSIALPVMQRDLHASAAQALWIVEAYTLVLGALMLLGGAAADRIGRDRVFVAGIFVFIAGSVWCGIAQDINTAIAARVLQGFGGVLVAPASLAIIGALFSGANRDKAVGTWTAFTALTSLVSPVAGGALVTAFGWRAVFYINVPLGLFTAYAAIAHIPETRDEERQGRPDILGSALIGCSLGCIVYALTAISGGEDVYISPHGGSIYSYRPEYNTRYGAACGGYTQVSSYVYIRKFQGALVIVNATGSSYSYTLPSGHQYHDIEGRTVNNPLTLAAPDAYVLLTSNGCS